MLHEWRVTDNEAKNPNESYYFLSREKGNTKDQERWDILMMNEMFAKVVYMTAS